MFANFSLDVLDESNAGELEEKPAQKKKRFGLEKEQELMTFRGIGTSPENLISFVQRVAAEHACPTLRAEAEGMLLRKENAFFPDDSDESLERYKDLLGDRVSRQVGLYRELEKRGVYFGGEKPF